MKLVYKELTVETINNKQYVTTANYIFPEGKGIGFVCMANQWKGNGYTWAYLNTNHRMYSSDPALNPENTNKFEAYKLSGIPEHGGTVADQQEVNSRCYDNQIGRVVSRYSTTTPVTKIEFTCARNVDMTRWLITAWVQTECDKMGTGVLG